MDYTEETISSAMTHGDVDSVLPAADPAAEHEAASTSAADGETTPDATQAEAAPIIPEETVFCPVYKGQEIPLRVSEREEITTLLQLGMKQRDFLPTYERLSFLAKEDGATSVNTWVEQLVKEREEAYREEAVRRYGEEAGTRYYALERREREQRYTARDAAQQEREDAAQELRARHERLAEEMLVLQEHYPAYRSFRDVPQEIVDTALREEISLLDACNRYRLEEQERCAREQAQSRRAAALSTGSLVGEPPSAPSPLDAFLRGLHSRM